MNLGSERFQRQGFVPGDKARWQRMTKLPSKPCPHIPIAHPNVGFSNLLRSHSHTHFRQKIRQNLVIDRFRVHQNPVTIKNYQVVGLRSVQQRYPICGVLESAHSVRWRATMCETAAAWSSYYTDWSPDVDERRLSTIENDYRQYWSVRTAGFRAPSEPEEAEASAILRPYDAQIRQRFGLDEVVSRVILCGRAMQTGTPIVKLSKALVKAIAQSPE